MRWHGAAGRARARPGRRDLSPCCRCARRVKPSVQAGICEASVHPQGPRTSAAPGQCGRMCAPGGDFPHQPPVVQDRCFRCSGLFVLRRVKENWQPFLEATVTFAGRHAFDPTLEEEGTST